MNRTTIAPARIVALRAALGVPQHVLGALLGVSTITVSRWERAAMLPTPWQVGALEALERAAARGAISAAERVAALGPIAALAELLTLGTNSCATPAVAPQERASARWTA